ncbi:hypothetical protein PE066_07415 [Ramlibacter tataouinensis]|uniref:hypothetical protein n=1 Tax=Ramlibacter tataouinensis TaxID=94132 RepID=UPI0022F3EE19|nr:hypothetical protein [Ramlibacter tataouinensis]WBY03352.1 hypothetical protein PE066_07415 [Ramlibacter tataouinensis]
MKLHHTLALLLPVVATVSLAKLPPPDQAAQAKAAEAKAKAAWQAKVDAWQLCKVQDRVAAKFGGKSGGAVKPVATAAAQAPAPAAAASGTPVASVPPQPCADPGPFAYTPAEQKPLEASGAHSPPGTASSPPSGRPEAAQMAPAKPQAAPAQKP